MVTRAKKTEYWILNTFLYNRVLLRNMLIYIAKHSFLYRKNIEMRPIKNRASFLTKFQIVSVLLKIAPYHMQKFGRYRKSSYLCTSNRRNSLSAETGHLWRPERGLNDGRRRSSIKAKKAQETGFPGSCDFLRTFKHRTEYD